MGFDEVGEDRGAPAIAAHFLGVLEEYVCVGKLVAQAYDGAAEVASGHGVQAKEKEKVPEATCTHTNPGGSAGPWSLDIVVHGSTTQSQLWSA